jgi:hypothetical protein
VADESVNLILKARDEATAKVRDLAKEVGGLDATMKHLTTGAGDWGAIAFGISSVAAAAVALGKQFSDNVERMDRVHDVTGAAVPQIQVLERSFENLGLGADSADKTIERMAKAIGNNDPLLKKLGITTRDAYTATMQLAKAFAESDDPATKTAIAVKLLGKSGLESAGVLSRLAEEAQKTKGVMQESGGLFGEQTLLNAEKLHAALDAFSTRWASMWSSMQAAALPAATNIVTAINSILHELSKPVDREAAGGGNVDGIVNAWKLRREEMQKYDQERERIFEKSMKWDSPNAFGTSVHSRTSSRALPKTGQVVIGIDADGTPIYGDAPDSASKVRENRLNEMMRVLQVGRAEAEKYIARLNEIEDARKGVQIAAEIGIDLGARHPELSTAGPGNLQRRPGGTLIAGANPATGEMISQAELDRMKAFMDAWLAQMPKMSGALTLVTEKWRNLISTDLSKENILEQVFNSADQAALAFASNGIDQATRGMLTFQSVGTFAVRAIEDEFKRLSARIIASGIMKLVLGGVSLAFGGVPGIAVAAIAGASNPLLSSNGGSGATPGSVTQITNHNYIQTLDSRSLKMAMAFPHGSFVRAQNEIKIGSAY